MTMHQQSYQQLVSELELVATTIHLLKSLMNNFHLRLCELEATHGQ